MRVLFYLLSYLLLCFSSPAQHNNYNIIHYTTDHGLPQNSITGIAFDKKGYCWLGTELGLVRFDGNEFRVFNSYHLKGLRSDRIRTLALDANGHVYARNDQWQNIIIDERDPSRSPLPRLFNEGVIPLWVVDGLVVEKNIRPEEQDLRSQHAYLVNLTNGSSYSISHNRLSYATTDSLQFVAAFGEPDIEKQMAVDDIYMLFDKNHLRVWKDGQLQKQMSEIQGAIRTNKAYREGRFICHQNAGQNYIYADGALYRIWVKNGQLTSEELLKDLPIRVVSKVYYHAAQRKYYIGSLVDGLYIVSLPDFNYPKQTPGAVKEGFYAQALTTQGDIICQRYLYRNQQESVKLPLNTQVGATLYFSPDQQLYYGNEPSLFRFDMTTGVNQKLMDLDSRPSSIYLDRTDSNTIILNTAFYINKLVGDSVHAAKRLPIINGVIKSVQTGCDSFILATANGVKWYDFARNKVYRSVLDSMYIRAVYPERDGKVWIATYGKGFYLYDNDRVTMLPINDHKGLLTVHDFIEDGSGNFWLPTNIGLYVAKKSMLVDYAGKKTNDVFYYMYSVFDNLRTNEFNGGCTPAYIWTRDSMLSIPSIAGLVQFYPHRIKQLWPDKKIYIDELLVDNKPVSFSSNGLTLDPDFKRLFVKISSPYFGSQENLQLEYMVEGLDKEWRRMPADGELGLNRVAAGNYRLVVRSNGVNENNRFEFVIKIRPWFYNTWWFRILAAVFILAIILLFLRLRTKRLKERNRKLQAIITEQTAALTESNRTKDRIITMVLHDLRSPIRFLHIVSSMLTKDQLKEKPGGMEEALALLKNSTGALNEFTDQFFTWAASQQEEFKVVNEIFSLQSLFEELYGLYADMAATNRNTLIIVPTDHSVYTDKNILSAIIRNLLDNANKNTTNGIIQLSAERKEEQLLIFVADTGVGMSAEVKEFYLNKSHQVGHHGNGSVIVIDLLKKIGGQLSIKNNEDRGTIFQIELNAR